MIKIDLKRHRKEIIGSVVVLLILLGGMSVFKYTSFNSGFEIVDDLGGNIFPSAILSVATTDAQVIVPSDSNYLGNPKSCIAVRVKSRQPIAGYGLKWLKRLFSPVRCRNLY